MKKVLIFVPSSDLVVGRQIIQFLLAFLHLCFPLQWYCQLALFEIHINMVSGEKERMEDMITLFFAILGDLKK